MLVIGRVPARFLLPLARRGGGLGAARDRPAAALPGRAASAASWSARTSPRPARAGPCGRRTSRSARGRCSGGPTTRSAACARSTCPSGRPTWRWPAWSGSGDWSPAPGRCSPRSSSCGGSRWPAGRSRTPHGALVGGGLAILMGVETVVSVGGNLGLLPLAGVPFPLLSYGGTALVVHLAAIGVVLAVRRDGARQAAVGAAAPAQPAAAAGPADRARPLGAAGLVRGLRMAAADAPRARRSRSSGQEQMTRCIRLPAARGSITDRHDAPLAVNAADVGSGVDRVLVVPALLRTRPGGRRPPRRADRPAARGPARTAIAAAAGTTLSLPVAEVPRGAGDAVTAAGIAGVFVVAGAAPGLPAGRAARAGARLRGGGHARGRGALARPAVGRGRRPRRPRAAVRRGAARDQRAAVPVRRPDGRAGRARRAAGPRARRRPAALDRPGAAAAAGRRPRRGRARAAPAAGQDRRRRRDGPEVGAGPRHREHPVVRQQHLRAAGRRRARCRPWPTRRGRRCSST